MEGFCYREELSLLLTKVTGDFIGAICVHPEEDPLRTADHTSTFINSECNKDPTRAHSLHVHITRYRQVLPERDCNNQY